MRGSRFHRSRSVVGLALLLAACGGTPPRPRRAEPATAIRPPPSRSESAAASEAAEPAEAARAGDRACAVRIRPRSSRSPSARRSTS